MTTSSRGALFFAYCVALGLTHLRVLPEFVHLGLTDSTASHVLLVPFVTLVLIYQDRTEIFARPESNWPVGLSLILGGTVLRTVAVLSTGHPDSLSLTIAALVLLLIGGFICLYGTESARAAAFPLFFLAFAIPLPQSALAAATHALKDGSTEAVAALFAFTGTPVHRQGFLFAVPGAVIEVADACSGIRSSIALLLTSLLAGHMFLRRTWTRLALVLVVLPITVLKNGVRIVGLTLLAVHVNPSFLAGTLHNDGGVLFFGLALAMLALPFAILRTYERRHARTALRPGPA